VRARLSSWPPFSLRKKARKDLDIFLIFSLIFLLYWAFSTRRSGFSCPSCRFYASSLPAVVRPGKPWLSRFVAASLLINVFLGGKEIAKKAPWDIGRKVSREGYLVRENPILSFYADVNRILGRAISSIWSI